MAMTRDDKIKEGRARAYLKTRAYDRDASVMSYLRYLEAKLDLLTVLVEKKLP